MRDHTCSRLNSTAFQCACSTISKSYRCAVDALTECLQTPCQNGGLCQNLAGATSNFKCTCLPGYAGATCATDVDECTAGVPPCANGATCLDSKDATWVAPNTFYCACPDGFSGRRCDLRGGGVARESNAASDNDADNCDPWADPPMETLAAIVGLGVLVLLLAACLITKRRVLHKLRNHSEQRIETMSAIHNDLGTSALRSGTRKRRKQNLSVGIAMSDDLPPTRAFDAGQLEVEEPVYNLDDDDEDGFIMSENPLSVATSNYEVLPPRPRAPQTPEEKEACEVFDEIKIYQGSQDLDGEVRFHSFLDFMQSVWIPHHGLFHEQADIVLGSRQAYDFYHLNDNPLSLEQFVEFYVRARKITALRQSATTIFGQIDVNDSGEIT